MSTTPPRQISRNRRGFTLVEVMVTVTIMGVLISFSVPSFQRAMEQSKADVAAANLHAIWSAQRLYWLDNRTYAANLGTLTSAGLLDPAIVSAATPFSYAIGSAGSTDFSATATRATSTYSGSFSIDETGALTGTIVKVGQPDIVPSFS